MVLLIISKPSSETRYTSVGLFSPDSLAKVGSPTRRSPITGGVLCMIFDNAVFSWLSQMPKGPTRIGNVLKIGLKIKADKARAAAAPQNLLVLQLIARKLSKLFFVQDESLGGIPNIDDL
jgi:hypothetical protein